jgi:lysozyme
MKRALVAFGFVSVAHAATTCPATVAGVDVSKYDGTVAWTTVRNAGVTFAMARISDGMDTDATFATNWAGMRAAGVIRGAYQFFEPADDPTTLAMIAAAAVGTLGAGDLPLVLDVEVTENQPMSTIVSHIQTWLDVAESATGKRPIIYTGQNFWDTNVMTSAFASYDLWVANYCTNCCPKLPAAFPTWRFWQYSDTGTVAGIGDAADLDTFNGTEGELAALSGFDLAIEPADLGNAQDASTRATPDAAAEPDHASGCSYADH